MEPTNTHDDFALARRFVAGDESAFCELVEQYGVRIAQLIRRLTGWDRDVDDIVQDVFLTALKKRGQFRMESQLSTWLCGIAVRLCRRRHDQLARRQRLLSLFLKQRSRQNQWSADRVVDEEARQQVRDAIHALPIDYREVIVLRFLEGYDISAIAELLQLSENLVKVRITRAKSKLETELKQFAGTET